MQWAQGFTGSQGSTFARAAARAINTYGCNTFQPILASAPIACLHHRSTSTIYCGLQRCPVLSECRPMHPLASLRTHASSQAGARLHVLQGHDLHLPAARTCDMLCILAMLRFACTGAYAIAQSSGQGNAFAQAAASAGSNTILSCYPPLQSVAMASASATAGSGSGGFNNGFNGGSSQAVGQVSSPSCLYWPTYKLPGEVLTGQ